MSQKRTLLKISLLVMLFFLGWQFWTRLTNNYSYFILDNGASGPK
mgnify:CR=1 FL=1